MWFKSYDHFHLPLTDGRADGRTYSDYSADPRVVQFNLKVFNIRYHRKNCTETQDMNFINLLVKYFLFTNKRLKDVTFY